MLKLSNYKIIGKFVKLIIKRPFPNFSFVTVIMLRISIYANTAYYLKVG